MMKFWQGAIATLLTGLTVVLMGCSSGIGSLQAYVNGTYGYQFLYPNGWIPVEISDPASGVDVVYRDLVEYSENLSVIISDVPANKKLSDLGTPTEVGYRFMQEANQKNGDRRAELLRAESRDSEGQTYYTLEYRVELPNGDMRHDLAAVVVKYGKLYTFNLSTPETRWSQVENLFNTIVSSFKV